MCVRVRVRVRADGSPSLRVRLQEFSTSGSSNTDSGKATGSLETKYKMKELGLTFNQKWNTDNTLSTGVTLEDQVGFPRLKELPL